MSYKQPRCPLLLQSCAIVPLYPKAHQALHCGRVARGYLD
jgi:hypothetical protein